MKLKIIAASFFLFAAVSIPSYLFLITDNKESVKTVKADPVQKVVSIPFKERFAHEAYMVKDQPGGDAVTWIEWSNGSFTYNRYNIVSKQKIATAIDLPKSTYFPDLVFAQQKNDVIWMGHGNRLVQVNSKTGENSSIELPFSPYAFEDASADSLTMSIEKVHAISGLDIDNEGNIWITRQSVRSLTRYKQGAGFKEFQATSSLLEPQRPVARQDGVLVLDAKRNVSEYIKSMAHVLSYSGQWSKIESPPGILKVNNSHGHVYMKSKNGDLIIDNKQTTPSNLNISTKGLPESLLSLGKNNSLWLLEENVLIKYGISDGVKKGYILPLKEAQNVGIGTSFGDAPIPELKDSPWFGTSIVANDGSFWASYLISGQLFIVGVPAN